MKKKTMDKKIEKISPESEPEKLDWIGARKRLENKIEEYKLLIGNPQVNPVFALALLHRLGARLSQGERTPELYKEIMNIK